MSAVRAVRWGVPVLLVAAGAVVWATVNVPVGQAIVVAAPCVMLAAWLVRLSVDDGADRRREEAAREFMDVHGHWPDERPSRGA